MDDGLATPYSRRRLRHQEILQGNNAVANFFLKRAPPNRALTHTLTQPRTRNPITTMIISAIMIIHYDVFICESHDWILFRHGP